MNIDITKLDTQITIRTMVRLLGGRIDEYPVIGTCVTLNGKRTCERDLQDTGNVAISYSWTSPADESNSLANQTLCRIFIGHKHAGPMLQCDANAGGAMAPEWRNCYSHGNYGKNYASGGNWSGSTKRTYPTATAAFFNRDYVVTGLKCDQQYRESQLLLDEICAFIARFEQ